MSRILLVACGGTISCVDTEEGRQPKLKAADFLPYLHLPPDIQVNGIDPMVRTILYPHDWVNLSNEILSRVLEYDGFVVTLGTDTLAYVGSALTLSLANLGKPVVLTGGEIITYENSDSPKNLSGAVTVAAAGRPGVFAVFNHYIYRADTISKMNAEWNPDAFQPVNFPRLGLVYTYMRGLRGETADSWVSWEAPDSCFHACVNWGEPIFEDLVLHLKLTPALDPFDLEEMITNGEFEGILVEGFGDGNVPDSLLAELMEEANQSLVVLASACPYGKVTHHYEGGVKLIKAGAVSAGSLTKEAALVNLMWSLAHSGFNGESIYTKDKDLFKRLSEPW